MNPQESIQTKLNALCKNFKRLPYLFVGSGFSRRYLGLPSWKTLLEYYARQLKEDDPDLAFLIYENMAEDKINSDRNQGNKFAVIASLLEKDFNTHWLNDPAFRQKHSAYRAQVQENESAFRLDVIQYIQESTQQRLPKLSEDPEIQKLKQIHNRNIGGVITTNYDILLEHLFPKFNPFVGQDDLLLKPMFGINEIYKIHGCVSQPSSIVITQKDYEHFQEKCDYLTAKLLTIFLENPIFFLGYSLSDENIRKILKSVAGCIPPEKQDEISKQLIFIDWLPPESQENEQFEIVRNLSQTDILPMTHVRLRSFTPVYEALAKVRSRYAPKLLYQLKHDIYKLVLTQEPTEKMYIQGLDDGKIPNHVEFVIGVGVLDQFGMKGFTKIDSDEIFEDIILDNLKEKYPHSDFHTGIIRYILNEENGKKTLPFYKYIQSVPQHEIPEKLWIKYSQTFDEIFPPQKSMQRGKSKFHSIREIVEYAEVIYKQIYNIKALLQSEIQIDELEDLLRNLLKEHPISTWREKGFQPYASQIRSLIRLYDWMKFKKEKGIADKL